MGGFCLLVELAWGRCATHEATCLGFIVKYEYVFVNILWALIFVFFNNCRDLKTNIYILFAYSCNTFCFQKALQTY